MGVRAVWLADAARATGYPVVEERNWQSRGYDMAALEGVVGHHTAGPKNGEYPSRNIILNGRTGLPGPLSQLGLGRSGTIYVVAAGRANHAGVSSWAGFSSLNTRFIGIEAESTGYGDWTKEQIDCYPRLVASLLNYMRRSTGRYAAHREIAIPAGRKPDPRGIESPWMRNQAGIYLSNTASISRHFQGGTPSGIPSRVLKQGDRGEDVKWVQQKLTDNGVVTVADGDFGPTTANNVRTFQARQGITADGIVGSTTVFHLNKTTSQKEEPVTETEKNEIAQKVFNLLQPQGGESLGTELDRLRRSTRKIMDHLQIPRTETDA